MKSKNKPIYNFPAIDLLYDPQSYAEKVFGVLKKSTERFEVRLMMMNFVSRLIGHHKLLLDNFYPFFINYMHPKQERKLIHDYYELIYGNRCYLYISSVGTSVS